MTGSDIHGFEAHEVTDALLLASQVYDNIVGPGLEGLVEFTREASVTTKIGTVPVRCDTCRLAMYRVRGSNVCVLSKEEQALAGALTIRPIVITIGYRKFVFCTVGCASTKLRELPDSELRSGYPLWR
jgi:hypothetical protein